MNLSKIKKKLSEQIYAELIELTFYWKFCLLLSSNFKWVSVVVTNCYQYLY